MDTKRRTYDITTWKKHLFLDISSTNTDTLVPSLYQCFETRSTEGLTVVSANFAPPFQPLRHHRNVCHSVVNRFTRQTLRTVNRTHIYLWKSFASSFCPQKCITERHPSVVHTLKHSSHFDYWNHWNQSLKTRKRVCYLDCHEAGLCCYLVIHIGNLYVLYRCLTSICDMFTESPPYIRGLKSPSNTPCLPFVKLPAGVWRILKDVPGT
jgi:hypothetical protein